MRDPRNLTHRIGLREFIALIAALMATQALAVDAMLPALPAIAHALHVLNANRAQWVVSAYVAGIGAGQLVWGLLSDRFGRRPVLLGGLALYVIAALACALAPSFHLLLAWRFVHGLAAASLVVSRSVVRDRYEGRQMARIMSLTMVIFLLVPMMAPTLGSGILSFAPWRAIFVVCAIYGVLVGAWTLARLPETLHPEYRLSLTRAHVLRGIGLVLGNRTSLFYTLAVTAMFASTLTYVGMVEQIFSDVFHRAALMPRVFALCAASMGVGAFLNSRIVERFGMRRISHLTILLFIVVTGLHLLVALGGHESLWQFVALQSTTLLCLSLTTPNFGTMAMEPVGSVAGIGASLQGCITQSGAALLAGTIGQHFRGSTVPLAAGALGCGLASLAAVLVAERGRLFRPHHPPIAHSAIAPP